jgi:two pore calcium channel protein
MKKPLLGGETSGARASAPPKDRKRAFGKRADAIAYGSPYEKAAALVDLAEDGVGLPEEILDQEGFESSAKLYFFFIRFDFLWSLNYFALIVLNFIEKPLWCAKYTDNTCSNKDYYFLGQLPYLNSTESLIYELVTLLILVVHAFFPISYEGFRLFWKSNHNRVKVFCLLILIADIIVYALYLTPVGSYPLPFRIAPYVRVVFFILNTRQLGESILILPGMMTTYLNVLALSLLFLLFASWIAYVMFEDTEQGTTLFTSFGATTYQMFVLFTTSNNPDVWIPAYKVSRWYSLFFILYTLLGVYFVTNLILAVVYDSFKSQLAKQVLEKDRMRTRILKKAFNLVDSYHVGFLNKEQCICLFEELNHYRTLPEISREDFEAIFHELDDSHDFQINLQEFEDLCNAIALKFQKGDVISYFEYFPSIYASFYSQKLKDFVKGPNFGYVVAVILLVNLAAVIVETTLDIQESTGQKFWQMIEFGFGWLYVLEMVLKVYAYGFMNYWRDGQNRFDFVITLVIVIGETVTFVTPDEVTFLSNGEWIRYLLLARMFRILRLLMHVKRYRAFISTFLTLIPSLMPYLGIIFCVMCFYCSIGVQIFGGLVNAGNPDVYKTDLADSDYLLFNFNDYPNGMVTLYNLVVMGNWQVWMQSYKELTGTVWTYVYFISFYLITILLLLNLVVAFVLEAFFAEIDLEEDGGAGEGKENEGKGRRYLGTKSRSQRVDLLLHRILSAELEDSNCPAPDP